MSNKRRLIQKLAALSGMGRKIPDLTARPSGLSAALSNVGPKDVGLGLAGAGLFTGGKYMGEQGKEQIRDNYDAALGSVNNELADTIAQRNALADAANPPKVESNMLSDIVGSVNENPWQTAGVAGAAGLSGLLLARLLQRRRRKTAAAASLVNRLAKMKQDGPGPKSIGAGIVGAGAAGYGLADAMNKRQNKAMGRNKANEQAAKAKQPGVQK